MTDPILPQAVTTMPYPWHISSDDRRRDAIAQLSQDASQRSAAVTALERCLVYLVQEHSKRGSEASQELPDEFSDSWIFFEQSFDRHMPTLADVTPETIRQWLADDPDVELLFATAWTTPPPQIVTAVARHWSSAKVRRICEQVMTWLRDAIWTHPDAAQRRPALTALEAAVPRLDSRTGLIAVGVLWDLGGTRELGFLASLENEVEAPNETREEAARLKTLAQMRAESSAAGHGDGPDPAQP